MKRKIIITVSVVFGIFALLSAAWFQWRDTKYSQYTDGMGRNEGMARPRQSPFHRAFAPVYWYGENCCKGVMYFVRFPDRLFSFSGSLVIVMPRHEEGSIYISPRLSGEYEFRAFGVHIDSQGNAIDSADDETIEIHRDTVRYLLNRAKARWPHLADV